MLMQKLQPFIDDVSVRALKDPTNGGVLNCALYGDGNTNLDIIQLLPLHATIAHKDRIVQGAALAEALGARVMQVTHQGFRGSSISLRQLVGSYKGDFSSHAKSVKATLDWHGPDNFRTIQALVVGESIGGVVGAHMAVQGVGALALVDAGGMFRQLPYKVAASLWRENYLHKTTRQAMVDESIKGMKEEELEKFKPNSRSPLPFNLALLPGMLFPGFGIDTTFSALQHALRTHDELHISGRVAEHSLPFNSRKATASYDALSLEFGTERITSSVVSDRSHYTITASAQEFAVMVAQQAVEVGFVH